MPRQTSCSAVCWRAISSRFSGSGAAQYFPQQGNQNLPGSSQVLQCVRPFCFKMSSRINNLVSNWMVFFPEMGVCLFQCERSLQPMPGTVHQLKTTRFTEIKKNPGNYAAAESVYKIHESETTNTFTQIK